MDSSGHAFLTAPPREGDVGPRRFDNPGLQVEVQARARGVSEHGTRLEYETHSKLKNSAGGVAERHARRFSADQWEDSKHSSLYSLSSRPQTVPDPATHVMLNRGVGHTWDAATTASATSRPGKTSAPHHSIHLAGVSAEEEMLQAKSFVHRRRKLANSEYWPRHPGEEEEERETAAAAGSGSSRDASPTKCARGLSEGSDASDSGPKRSSSNLHPQSRLGSGSSGVGREGSGDRVQPGPTRMSSGYGQRAASEHVAVASAQALHQLVKPKAPSMASASLSSLLAARPKDGAAHSSLAEETLTVQREHVAERRQKYAAMLSSFRRSAATNICIGGGATVCVKDLKLRRESFHEMGGASGYITAQGVQNVLEKANDVLVRMASVYTTSDLQMAKLKYQAFGFTTKGKGDQMRFCGSLLLDHMHGSKLSWKSFLKILYPHATKEGISRLCGVHESLSQVTDKMRVLTEKERNDFDGLWLQWDVDGNGVLDRDEFKMALKMLNLDSFDVNDIYDQVDRDGNGTIEKHEFAAWYFTDQTVNDGPAKIVTQKELVHRQRQLKSASSKPFKESVWRQRLERGGLSTFARRGECI